MIDLDSIVLSERGRNRAGVGHSLMEAVSMFAGEGFSHEPVLVCPVLRSFGDVLNNSLDDDGRRQELKRFIARLPGTASDGRDEARWFLAVDWLVRECAPTWMRLVPELTSDASLLAHLSPITDGASAKAAAGVVGAALASAGRVSDDARDLHQPIRSAAVVVAASDAVWAAVAPAKHASLVALQRATNVVRPTANSTAQYLAAAASLTAREAADAAAMATARNAGCFGDNSWDADRGSALNAAGVAESFLAPTVAALQESTINLFDRMIAAAPATD